MRWVSEEEGDGLGYDIRSFHDEGKPLYIEVKTTNGGAAAPFYVSPNEVEVSKELKSHYAIYRVFDFAKQPRVFVLRGSIAATCKLEPSGWKASVKDDLKDS